MDPMRHKILINKVTALCLVDFRPWNDLQRISVTEKHTKHEFSHAKPKEPIKMLDVIYV